MLTLKCRGRGTFANQTWLIHSKSVADFTLVAHGEDVVAPRAETAKDKILGLLKEGPSDAENIGGVLGLTYGTTRAYLSELIREGSVDVVGKNGRSKLYGPA